MVGATGIEMQQLNTELAEKNTNLNLTEKFDRVMEFLKLKSFKKKWENLSPHNKKV